MVGEMSHQTRAGSKFVIPDKGLSVPLKRAQCLKQGVDSKGSQQRSTSRQAIVHRWDF